MRRQSAGLVRSRAREQAELLLRAREDAERGAREETERLVSLQSRRLWSWRQLSFVSRLS